MPPGSADDPFLNEVHALKEAASARFQHDVRKMGQYAQALAQKRSKARGSGKRPRPPCLVERCNPDPSHNSVHDAR